MPFAITLGLILLATLLMGGIGGEFIVAAVGRRGRRRRFSSGPAAIAVLGAPAPRGLSPTLAARLDTAVALHGALGCPIIVSGDDGRHRSNEVEAMAQGLRARGIADGQIVRDPSARRTVDSIRWLARRGESVVLVTSGFHLDRALFLAWGARLAASGAASATPVPRQRYLMFWLRERASRVRAYGDVGVMHAFKQTPVSPERDRRS